MFQPDANIWNTRGNKEIIIEILNKNIIATSE